MKNLGDGGWGGGVYQVPNNSNVLLRLFSVAAHVLPVDVIYNLFKDVRTMKRKGRVCYRRGVPGICP